MNHISDGRMEVLSCYSQRKDMRLTEEERNILEGEKGSALQKVMKTLLLYGQALDSDCFVDLEGPGHLAIPFPLPGAGPRREIIEELTKGGLTTKLPFTVDPRVPLDFKNLGLSHEQEKEFEILFPESESYEQLLLSLGLRDQDAYTCTCYLPQVGNTPKMGTILAWSESSAIVFANSVLGARTNRNAVITDILCNIIGKAPLTGLLTDDGRKASCLVNIRNTSLPHPQLLGGVIGEKLLENVPYLVGLDKFLGPGLNDNTKDYLKEMGAACAAIGATGLYHVENITPEAVIQGKDLLLKDHKTYVIDDQKLSSSMTSYPVMWADKKAKPQRCLIGCPHLSLNELYYWSDRINDSLKKHGRETIAVPTYLFAAPGVLREFINDEDTYLQFKKVGVKFTSTCPESILNNKLIACEAVITNSNKCRAFSTAKMLFDDELVEGLVTGELNGV